MLKKTWLKTKSLVKKFIYFMVFSFKEILIFIGCLLILSLIVFLLGGEKAYMNFNSQKLVLGGIHPYSFSEGYFV